MRMDESDELLSDAVCPYTDVVDSHLVYALVLLFFIATPEVGKYLGIGNKWQKLGIVKKYPILK